MNDPFEIVATYSLTSLARNLSASFHDFIFWPFEDKDTEGTLDAPEEVLIQIGVILWDGSHVTDTQMCVTDNDQPICHYPDKASVIARKWMRYNETQGISEDKQRQIVEAALKASTGPMEPLPFPE